MCVIVLDGADIVLFRVLTVSSFLDLLDRVLLATNEPSFFADSISLAFWDILLHALPLDDDELVEMRGFSVPAVFAIFREFLSGLVHLVTLVLPDPCKI